MRALYRVQQGVQALLADVHPVDDTLAQQYLSAPLLACFRSMHPSDQRHSIQVLRTILSEGSTPHDLIVAALLHDMGKSRYAFPVWQKTLVVLVRALLPNLFARLSAGDESHWVYRPFVLSEHHPAWGATMIATAGASKRAIWLVAEHATPPQHWHNHPDAALLSRLQAADDAH